MRTSQACDDNSNPCQPWPGTAALLGWLAGCALQLQQAALLPWGWVALASGVALALGAMLARRPARSAWIGWLVVALLLGWASTTARAHWRQADALAPELDGQDLRITGQVSSLVQRSELGLRWRMTVDSAQWRGQPVTLPPELLLSWYGPLTLEADDHAPSAGTPLLRPGQRWQLSVRLKAPHGLVNPHGWDDELWLWTQGLHATGYVRPAAPDAPPQWLGDHWTAAPVARLRQTVRDAILARLDDGSPDARRRAGVIAALAVGDQSAIDRADWEVLRQTGVAHLMSISGLHITLFAWLAAALLGRLWRRSARWGWRLCLHWPAPTVALWGGVLCASIYAGFSGWGVPAQRTVLMLVCVAALRSQGLGWPAPVVWLLAAGAVVLLDPWALLQAGFWLSFVAVGVLMATDAGVGSGLHQNKAASEVAAVAAPRRHQIRAWLARHGGRLLREQAVVTLALSPLTLLLFGQVSLVGLLANLLAIPWVTLLVMPLALAGMLWPVLWTLADMALQPLLAVLQQLAALPGASWQVALAPIWVGIAGVLGGGLLVLHLPWGLRLLGLPLLLPVLLWQAPRPASGQFELLGLDIGQGNAVLIRTAQHSLLYDTGPRSTVSDAGQRVLVPLLRALDEQLDGLILSHRDSDHTGGARAVLAQQPQAWLLSSLEDGHPLLHGRNTRRCARGQRWTWDGVQFELLHPGPQPPEPGTSTNAQSCVLRISNGAQRVLLVGDIEAPQEAELLRLLPAESLRADGLLVPHHGSKTSSSAPFLDAVQPNWALVQAGHHNRYGHPAPSVLVRYAERGIRIIETPQCGAWRWHSADAHNGQCQRAQTRRYWHASNP